MTSSTKAGLTTMIFWTIAVIIAIMPQALLDVIFITAIVLGLTWSIYFIAKGFYETS